MVQHSPGADQIKLEPHRSVIRIPAHSAGWLKITVGREGCPAHDFGNGDRPRMVAVLIASSMALAGMGRCSASGFSAMAMASPGQVVTQRPQPIQRWD